MDDFQISLHYLETVDSTNTYVKLHASDLPDGTLVYAGSQSAGHGRFGRVWVSPAGCNFYGSLWLKDLTNPFLGTIIISLSALDALTELVPELPVWLKWPNDLYVGSAKLAGVLSEAVNLPDHRRAVIAGIGVNLNLEPEELKKIGKPATSVFAAVNQKINPKKFASVLAEKIKKCYIKELYSDGILFDLWRQQSDVVGLEIELDLGNNRVASGIVSEIAPDGALVLTDASGTRRPFYSGDVTVTPAAVRKLAEKLAARRSHERA